MRVRKAEKVEKNRNIGRRVRVREAEKGENNRNRGGEE